MKVNGVFEGGGVRGISLTGAVRAAEMAGVTFHQVAGTSAGSIVAALTAAGYTATEMREIIAATPFASFLQRAPLFNVKVIGPAIRLFLRKGLYAGDALQQWAALLLAAKGIRTFGDLPPGKLRIIASDITNGKLLVLPGDIADYGIDPMRLEVARAIRMSASIPYFFDPVLIRQPLRPRLGRRRMPEFAKISYVVDGGLLSNFPLWVFKEEEGEEAQLPVLGFQMVGRPNPQGHRIGGPFSMFYAMFETMLSAHDERYIEKDNRIRTIKIPTLGVRTTDFHLTAEKSEALYHSGLEAGHKYFGRMDRQTCTIPLDPPEPPSPRGGSGPRVNLRR
ncbi:patatin-like phospholipase family protein [Cohnella nanjingensis]|uniref:Patatin-like phospholipase family protein n=1 Tax=Cohnella nanjingensis TaxID=1387779 RepID=A0A7X0RX22_9BACL|nr:patatin-like phospholipase family protein [Cohnella nanjingensis]MBB6675257.1 patatin-like phospholipase family protein [Cohnella nanjingensis]